MGDCCGNFIARCLSQRCQFTSYSLPEIVKRLATGRCLVWITLEPGSGKSGVCRLNLIPRAPFPITKINLAQARSNLHRHVVVGGERVRGLDRSLEVACIDDRNRPPLHLSGDSCELPAARGTQLWIGVPAEAACHIGVGMAN